jgi:hypothetical protein
MVVQRPRGIQSVWRKFLHRIASAGFGAAAGLCAMGFPIDARGDEQHRGERTGITAGALFVARTADAEQLSRMRAGGSSALDLAHTLQLGVILWDEARPPAPPVRNAAMSQTQAVTASVQVVVK